MHAYRLKLHGDAQRCAKQVEFEAEDGLKALAVAQQQAGHRPAELWRDGQLVCIIEKGAMGFWRINPAQEQSEPLQPARIQVGKEDLGASQFGHTPPEEARLARSARRPRLHLRLA